MIIALKKLLKRLVLLFNNNENVKRVTISALSFVIVFAVFVSVFSVTDLTYAVEVSVKGENCGYVTDRKIVDKAVDALDEISVSGDKNYAKPQVDCTYAVVPSSQLISSGELADNIVDSDDNVNKVNCVIINDSPFAEVGSVEEASSILNGLAGEASFYNDVEIRECVLSDDAKSRLKDLSQRLDDKLLTDVDYETVSGDTKKSVAHKFGVSSTNIPDFNIGDVISIKAYLPAFALATRDEHQTQKGVSASETVDKSGWEVSTYATVYVNDIKLRTDFIGTEFVEKFPDKPVATEIVDAGNIGWCWPVDTSYKQYVSSYWGDGRGHKGYDIAASKGTPILSVSSGKVESINSSGEAYGLHFVIDHGNGLKTLYAHCSKLYISEGEKVERGEVVALIGATGRATGTHLHFEVFKNGARTNPKNYIGTR